MVSSGGGKTSDEIVYELAENILGKLPDNLDMDKASKALFEVKLHLGNRTRLIYCSYGGASRHFIFSHISIATTGVSMVTGVSYEKILFNRLFRMPQNRLFRL